MSGQDVTSPQCATKEAVQDARSIQSAMLADTNSAYQLFRSELDDVDTNVKDGNLKAAYQDSLLKTLGESNVNTLMLEYLNDPKGGAELKRQGQISRLSIAEKRAQCATPGALSATDRVFLPQLTVSFDNLRDADPRDGQKNKNSDEITENDLRAARSKLTSDRFTNLATSVNRKEKFADSILDPTRSDIFDRIEMSDDMPFTRRDGKISRSNLREFLEDAGKYNKPDKDFRYPPDLLQNLKYMHDNWDSPQVRMLRDKDGKGNMNRDSIARGCGYSGGYADYVENYRQSKLDRKEIEPHTSQRDRIEKEYGAVERDLDCKKDEKKSIQSVEEFRKSRLSVLAKQESTQGYWQVGAKLLKESPVEKENALETSRQNVILMRALQALHRQQHGKLGGHEFLATPKDFEILTKEIDKYAQSRSERTRTSAEALKKRLEKLRTN